MPHVGLGFGTASNAPQGVIVQPIERRQVRLIPADPDAGKPARLYLRPKDRFGNYLGPGYENRLDITIANATAELVSEQLDGSYIIPLDPNTNLSTASVEVKLDGKVLLKFDLGKLSEI